MNSETGDLDIANEGSKVIVNGVEVPYDASLYWLVLNMSSVDNFLYLTPKPQNPE